MSRSAPVALVAGLVAILAGGCGSSGPATGHRRQQPQVVAVIKGLDNPFFVALRDGLVDEAHARGVSLRLGVPPNSFDAGAQATRLEALISPAAGCYIVNPIGPDNLIQPLAQLRRGTPIINVDNPVGKAAASAEGVKITSFVGTDDYAAGAEAADAMARRVSKGANVAVISGTPGDVPSGQRVGGFVAAARGRFAVVQTVAADYEQARARLATEQLLRTYPDLRGIFAANDLMALGADQAVQAAGRRAVVTVVGLDGIPQALAAVQHGEQAATVAQLPYAMGQLAVLACLAAIAKKHVPADIVAPVELITKSNAALARARYPHPIAPITSALTALRK